ncbi:MAG: glycosyltransferase family 2 protein [Isosphaeraceae bacterium]
MPHESVSLIIPAYQSARTIGRTLDSVLSQTRRPDEILIVNDGSTDELMRALRPYANRVFLVSKPNGGAASARNLGIDRSAGDLIAFLDADDTWEPRKLEHQLRILEEHPEVGLVAGRFYEQQDREPRSEVLPVCSKWMDRVHDVRGTEAMELATRVWTSTVVVRRRALGHHRFQSGLEPAEDRDLWFRLIRSNPVYLSSELLATQFLVPNSLSRSNLDVDCGNMLRVVRRHADELGRRGLRHWEASCFRRWAGNHLAQGRPRKALAPAYERLKVQPFSPEAWGILAKAALRAARELPRRSPTRISGAMP